ncbi:nucleoside diphosphate kinase regulator [Arvimicrobium flavum]|uniref:nucleoside diphosphate kinase regulator n=1 Tax=Arvimicrobium flavum TaxID=3393320 RepID=UPI00237A149D|nr:nucleoside diphosphate kinase regulator [Mesorhizobium shangrilense]
MQEKSRPRRKPEIRIAKTEHARLSVLAESYAERNPDLSDELLAELDRARVVADDAVPATIVRMGSTVTFKPDTGEAKTVTLVFPGDADIAQGKVSILTPIGTALIGLSAGQSMAWTARDGRTHELSVLSVDAPESTPDPAPSVLSA